MERSDYKSIRKAWEIAKKSIDKLLVTDAEKKDIKLFEEIKNDKDFIYFTKFFSEKDSVATNILNDLYTSWDIYTTYRSSHRKRVEYIRHNFLTKYRENEIKNPGTKYFIKFGAVHAAKNMISLGSFDIGVLTQELAVLKKQNSISAYIAGRFQNGHDSIKEDDNIFLRFGSKSKWVAIDLKKINTKLLNGEISILDEPNYQDIKEVIDGYDILIITPDDTEPKLNYTTKAK